MIKLQGKAEDVGRIFGEVAGEKLRAIIASSKREDSEAENLRKILEEAAPHWLLEGRAMAESGGVEFSQVLSYNLPAKMPADCTSFLVSSEKSKEGFPILHKNRDFSPEPQVFYVKKIEGFYKFIGGGSPPDLGTAFFLNEAGLAGACNTGGEAGISPKAGLLDRHVLRLIAERANSCESALKVVEEALQKGWLATEGKGRGFILLLADGKDAMIVEYTPREYRMERIKEGIGVRSNHFLLLENKGSDGSSLDRLKRAEALLGSKEKVSLGDIWEVAKDRWGAHSICNSKTISAFTALLHPSLPFLSLAFLFPGPPDRTIPFPLSATVEEIPLELASGKFWRAPD